MNEYEQQIILAVQKPNGESNRNLGDDSVALLKAGGLSFTFKPRVDEAPTNISGLTIVKMKNGDLSRIVTEGEADLAIVGLDMYQEYPGEYPGGPKAKILKPLGFSRCILKLGIKTDFDLTDPKDLAGFRIATSYPNITAGFFEGWNTPIRIKTYLGGEEGVVKRGEADACVVISDSSTSFTANGLKAGWNVLESQTMLIANPNLSEKRGSEQIVWRALRAVMTGLWKTQYIMLEANFLTSLNDEVLATLPSAKSPTVLALQSGGQATRSLVPISNLEESLQKLYAAGASEVVALEVKSVYPNLDEPEVTRMMKVIYGQNWHLPNPCFAV